MGLLDDAIRDHLDLKRRRGADPAELERAEREALGPVRREPFEPEGYEPRPASGGDADDQGEELYDNEEYDEAPFSDVRDWGDAFEAPALPAEDEPQRGPEFDDATRVMGSTPFEDEFMAEEEDSGVEPYSAGSAGDETAAYDVDEAIAAEDAEPPSDRDADVELNRSADLEPEANPEPQPGPQKQHGEDVLEETPDFLQDTPDHDRLWFEQRPPRDFDFDD